MKVTRWTICLIGFCSFCSSLSPGGPPAEITAITYNTHYMQRGVPGLIRTLSPLQADVIAMQEVLVQNGHVSSQTIAQHLGMNHVSSLPYVAYGNSQWVLTILTRYPVLYVDQRLLGANRRALRVLLNVKGHRVNFVTMHLTPYTNEHPLKEANQIRSDLRKREIKDLLEWIGTPPDPVVLLGDFNMLRGAVRLWGLNEYSLVTSAGYTDADGGFLPTNSDTFPLDEEAKHRAGEKLPEFLVPSGITLDYVFLAGKISVLSTDVLKSDASDHYPLLARLRVGY
ncbi:MAG TPA: hypothetical protein PKE49_12305 [Leptospiraceae bacterium]|nr:hypothetical protein [Leptospirales bacterium]HMU82398.1 hypothetical protein [Leptospiraceae bacterium]HMW60305.1 hypothetical protein [Leptospiraceae bacterium]HMX57302.1 hypothetical protein [Leptospiraceae bacterium]HNL70059.1 hypothetical protein [Leptospiraceae bacterium]